MSGIITSLIYVFTSCVMLFLSKIAFDKFSPFKPEEQLKENNPTPIIAFVGYLVGVTFILVGAYVGPAASSFNAPFSQMIWKLISNGTLDGAHQPPSAVMYLPSA